MTAETEARLREINALRRRVAAPLLALERRGREASTAAGQAAALALYFEDLRLPETLEKRAAELLADDALKQAVEAEDYKVVSVG